VSGPSGSTLNAERSTAGAFSSLGQTELGQSQEQYQQYKSLIQPAITKYGALAGLEGVPQQREAAVAAAAPTVGTIASGYDAAKTQIMNNIPPGAARDQALANLELQKASGTAGAFASEVQGAPDVLANIGAGVGAYSLQQIGAALSGLTGAQKSYSDIASQQNQAKANTVGLISGIAGAAGTAAGGYFGKH